MVGLRTTWSRLYAQRFLQKRSSFRKDFSRNMRTLTVDSQCRSCKLSGTMNTPICNRNMSSIPPMQDESTSMTEDLLDSGDGISMSAIDKDIDFHDVDEHDLSHLRTKLYPIEADPSGAVSRLYEAASVQEVFDIVSSVPEINYSPIIASQALVTLWDLQKLLYKLGPIFHPEEDIQKKFIFVENIKKNQIFQNRILRPVLEMHQDLEDEPLCASLLALKKMNFTTVETEAMIEECIRRKDTLCLPGLSRLSVCLRTYNLYGQCVMSFFSPLILKYTQSMSDDIEVRLVSILLRNASRVVSESIFKSYISRLSTLLDSDIKFEIVTYCKMFLVILDGKKLSPQSLIHNVGYRLKDRVRDMGLMELLSLQKYLMGGIQEPWPLIESLISRVGRVIEESKDRPRIDLISSVGGYLRGSHQKKRLAQIAHDCIDNNDFLTIQNVVYPLIRSLKTPDRSIYDKYWNKAVEVLDKSNGNGYHRTIILARNYLNFTHSHLFSYRNFWVESVCKKHLYSILDKYLANPPQIIISPSEFAIIIAFQIAFDQSFLDLKYISKFEQFVPNMRAQDIINIVKGVDCALFKVQNTNRRTLDQKNYEIVSDVCAILEEECALRLEKSDTSRMANSELSMVWRVLSIVRKIKGDSPLLEVGIKAFSSIDPNGYDSREIREACVALNSGSYFYPQVLEVISDYVSKNSEHMNPETVDRFLTLTYNLGCENDNMDFGKLADVIESNWERLGLGIINCAISLGFHHQLRQDLIDKIFNVDFLDHIDEELRNVFGKNHQYPFKLRMNLMELNRIVCLDVPHSRLPWFHEKFCQNILSQGRSKPTYLHNEVAIVLDDLIGEGAVQSGVCLPQDYYYNIDFVLKFDHSDRPIKTTPTRTLSFSLNRPPIENSKDVKRKIAILVLSNSAFTKNVRQLKGGYKMKQRHLEMLGYEVVTINPCKWNSMHMSEMRAKQQFLESAIFKSNK